ncbi:MAG: penicillin-binding protein 1C [Pseudomonadota bacterium]
MRKNIKKLSYARVIISFTVMTGIIVGTLFLAYTLEPLSLKALENVSVVVTDRKGRLLRAYATKNGIWRLPVKLEDIDPQLIKVLLAYEDKRYHSHFGVDPLALVRATWQVLKYRRVVSGGSTITMQVVRLLEGRHERTLMRKLIQIIRAIQLERQFSKDQILQMYFTLAPYGGNIEGVRAATLAYYNKEPKRLSPHEAALLVALPQAPTARRPDRHPKQAKHGRNRVLKRMRRFKVLSSSDVKHAMRREVPNERLPFPLYAAHLSDAVIAQAPHKKHHQFTIDRNLQTSLETLSANYVKTLGPKLSTALLVANHKSGEILAYVGSAGYLDYQRFGAIDMVQAVRSPGSALKPFVYGLAFDAGIAHPETLIEDAPVRFDDYAPENFDKMYYGTLSMRQALQTSLNIPVVKLLAEIGPARLVARFKLAGLKRDIPTNLSIALGGIGIKLKELAQLYSAFPRGGEPIQFRYLQRSKTLDRPVKNKQTVQILSKKAAWYVADILKGVRAPKNAKGGTIAFKTGTSYGYRDAWSVGFDGRHVVAVWIGRPDNSSTPGLLGLSSAAPLLFDTFKRISPNPTPLPNPPASALQVGITQLPAPLQNFDLRYKGTQKGSIRNQLRIAFPPNKSELEILTNREGKDLPIALKAHGGTLPLTWLVDGKPIGRPSQKRQTFWHPNHNGFIRLTVIDAEGRVDRVYVRVY